MQSDISGYFHCLPKHHSRLLKHPEKHHYINSCNSVIILLSGMSSDVSHPAGVGFQWKAAVGMSQRLRGGAGTSSEMLSPTTRRMPGTVAGCTMREHPTNILDSTPFPKDMEPQLDCSALLHRILKNHIFAKTKESKAPTSKPFLNNLGFSLKAQTTSF